MQCMAAGVQQAAELGTVSVGRGNLQSTLPTSASQVISSALCSAQKLTNASS